MERGLKIIFLLLILVLSLSVVSAGFFSDFWNKITGKSVETCIDSDEGLNYSEKGVVYYGQNEFNDYCLGSDLVEWYCKYNEVSALKYKCPVVCQNGACVSEECTNYYADKDNDGYGDSKDSKCLTSPTEGYEITIAGDCNDNNATINPNAEEVCDSFDNNCDGKIDENCPGVDAEPPQIIIIYPQSVIYPSNITILNYSANDDNLESCWYSLDNGITNSSPDATCLNYTGLTSNEGINIWIVYANDSFGNSISETVIFNIGEEEICEDGTLYGTCSSIKPKYCDNDNLINNCSLCGCPSFYECQSDGSCSEIIFTKDSDNDGILDIHDPDADGDSILDFPYVSINADGDIDGDGILNINDKDIDGDGILNGFDIAFAIVGEIETIENISPEEISDFPSRGYIVELEDKPLAVQKSELEEQAEKNEGNIIAQAAGTIGLTVTYSNLESKVESRRNNLKKDKERAKEKIKDELGKSQIVTGSAIAEGNEDDLIVLEEYENVFNGIALNITFEEAEEIKELREVKAVYPNYEVKALLMDSVPLINADDVWQLDAEGNNCSASGKPCLTGQGITIGIIDTGVDYTHGDLGGCLGINCKVVGGYDFVNNDNDPMDDHGHGTHCAAIATGKGVLKGVAPDAKVYAYKVLNSGGSGSWNNVIAAIERSVDPNQDGNFEDHLDIISLSLGGPGNPDDPVSKAIDNAVEAGVIAVVAAGNSGPREETIGSPGTARKAITIGASTKDDYIAWFSSRGPVKWTDSNGNEKYFLKPDVIAPGVNICAAQWNNAWQSNECLDTEHTAISGTSMATPHVAGASALLLQKNPTWSPEEIKMALRNTAVDIFYHPYYICDCGTCNFQTYIEAQGYGKINALKSIGLNQRPCIARLQNDKKVSGKFDIIGEAYCDNFESYNISIRQFQDPSDCYTEIYSSSIPVNGILMNNFNTGDYEDGKYILKIEVIDSFGNVWTDKSLIYIKNMELFGIGENLNYLKDIEDVKGKILFLDYDAYKVEYQTQLDYNYRNDIWTEICYSAEKPTSEVLCSINVSSFENGVYYFRISALINGTWISSDSFKVIVFKEMFDGWPVEINGFPQGMPNIGNEGNGIKLIVPHYAECMQSLDGSSDSQNYNQNLIMSNEEIFSEKITNASTSSIYIDKEQNSAYITSDVSVSAVCMGSSLYIYNPDGSSKIIDKLYYDSESNFVPSDGMPSIYKDIEQEEYIALMDYWGSTVKKPGIINFNGSYIYKWPASGGGEGSFVIWGDKLFNTKYDFNNKKLFINGFNKDGTILDNFPINVENELRDYSLILYLPHVFKSNTSKSIAILAGNYNVMDGFMHGLVLFLDIYSMEGNLIKRIKLFDKPSTSIFWPRITHLVGGDMNNDGNSEIIVGFSIVDKDLFFANKYDINAYETFFYIFDSDGNVISTLDSIKGYMVKGGILANLGRENLSFIATLSDTWPTTYNGQKIIAFDYNGNIIFDTNLSDYNDLIQGLVVGDVDSDNESEIIINYRPRWYNSKPSGFQIFNKNGILERDIEIPTMGEVDDYWGAIPILTDFNNDNKIDIIQQSLFHSIDFKSINTRIYAFSLEGSYNPETMEWPMFQHDPQHTGLYTFYGEEICDGLDNDKDGEIDEGCEELCKPHESYSCYDNDVYWYDSCGNIEEIKEDCGGNFYKIATENGKFSCSSIKWDRYCDGDHKKRDYLCYENTCSGNSCEVETHVMDPYSKYCRNGCRRGRCRIWLPGRRKVICTELYNLGYLDKEKYEIDLEYAAKHFSQEAIYGYQAWAIPVVKAMRKNPEETKESVIPLVNAFIEEIAYRMGKEETGNEIGALFLDRGIPLFERIGKHINEPDWKVLFNEENLIYKILDKLKNVKINKYDDLVRNYFSEDKIREMYFDAKEKSNGLDMEFANALLDNLEKAVEEIESMIEKEN